ncbi:MAG: hypothetical protein U1F48_11760 [Burkholderiales bacterium]
MKSILDPSFRYTPSTATDVRKTFARVRREMQRAQAARRDAEPARVVPLQRALPATGRR